MVTHELLPELNFSIRLPGCSAKCDFCYYKDAVPESLAPCFTKRLGEFLSDGLPVLRQRARVSCGITGGEPTERVELMGVLELVEKHKSSFERVVLATNAIRLMPGNMQRVTRAITHLNISRHDWDDNTNSAIFGVQMPSREQLRAVIVDMNVAGVEAAISCVIDGSSDPTLPEYDGDARVYVETLVEFCKWLGASRLIVRRDSSLSQNGVSAHKHAFASHATIYKHDCSVCTAETKIIDGVYVTFKESAADPGRQPDFEELIFQPNGTITYDWAGEDLFWSDGEFTNEVVSDGFHPGMYHREPEQIRQPESRQVATSGGGCGPSTGARC